MRAGSMPHGEIIELDPTYDPDQRAPTSEWEEPFRQCMRRLAAGVSVITCRSGASVVGLTATSVTSLSLSPPSLVVSVRTASSALPHFLVARRFTVHLLDDTMQRAADAFAGRLGTGPRETLVAVNTDDGKERLASCLAVVDCRLSKSIPVFTHALLVGVVESAEVGRGDGPLLYFDGKYRRVGSHSGD